jgi:hypothetical protein
VHEVRVFEHSVVDQFEIGIGRFPAGRFLGGGWPLGAAGARIKNMTNEANFHITVLCAGMPLPACKWFVFQRSMQISGKTP